MTPRQFGPYELLEIIGVGGMGEVWRARDHRRERLVALKLLPESLSRDEDFLNRFRRESHVAARLREPHVVPIHDYGEIDGRLYIDMRLVDGLDLGHLLREGGPLPADRAVALLSQVAEALEAAHGDGLVHRDVKPSNILVTPNDFVYVVDFGIARSIGSTRSSLTLTGATVGTLDYMAPERFANAPLDGRVDVYSLACVLSECLTAKPPFSGDSLATLLYAHLYAEPPRPSELAAGVPRELDAVVAKGMAKMPDERYATPVDLIRGAKDAVRAAGLPTPGSGPLAPPRATGSVATPRYPSPAPPEELAAPEPAGRAPETALGAVGVVSAPPSGSGGPPPGPNPVPLPPWQQVGVQSAEGGHNSVQQLPSPHAPEPPGPAGPSYPLPPPPPPPGGRKARWWLLAAALSLVLVAGTVAVLLWRGGGEPSADGQAGSDASSGQATASTSASGETQGSAAPSQEPAVSLAVPSVEGDPVDVNPTPGFMAVEPDGRQAYIANRDEGIVTVWDTNLDQVTGTIKIPDAPPWFITFSPDGNQAYITATNAPDYTKNIVVFVDTRTNRVTHTVRVGLRPFAPQTSPDGKLLYVPLHNEGRVQVFDTTSAKEVASYAVPHNPHWIAVSADGQTGYTANHESNVVTVLDLADNGRVVTTIPVGTSPHSIAISPDGTQVSVCNFDSNNVSVIDIATNKVVATIPVGAKPQDLTYAPDGRHMYTANVDGGTVSVIDTETDEVTASLPLGTSPSSVAVLPDGTKAYVTDLDSGTVRILRTGDR
jgi:YVTN family beta-propeller protein